MGLFTKLFLPKRHAVEDSGTLLLALGRKRGLSDENREPMLAWAVFKEFCLEYHFQCDDDAVLWEIGPLWPPARWQTDLSMASGPAVYRGLWRG